MRTCYIVGAGEFYGGFTPGADDLVIAADGGYSSLNLRGIRCDLLIGDMDSISELPRGVEILRHKVEKDETDMHLAYLEGKARGYSHFAIYGGVGGRADHTFANYCLLSYIRSEGCTATLYGDGNIAFVIKNEATRVSGTIGNTVSVFAFGGVAEGVSLKGLYYPLEAATLTPDFPLGISNSLKENECEIGVKRGTLLIIQQI